MNKQNPMNPSQVFRSCVLPVAVALALLAPGEVGLADEAVAVVEKPEGAVEGDVDVGPYPRPDAGYVTDLADMLSRDEEERIERLLWRAEEEKGVEIAVLTIESLQDYPGTANQSIESFATEVFNRYRIGNLPKLMKSGTGADFRSGSLHRLLCVGKSRLSYPLPSGGKSANRSANRGRELISSGNTMNRQNPVNPPQVFGSSVLLVAVALALFARSAIGLADEQAAVAERPEEAIEGDIDVGPYPRPDTGYVTGKIGDGS